MNKYDNHIFSKKTQNNLEKCEILINIILKIFSCKSVEKMWQNNTNKILIKIKIKQNSMTNNIKQKVIFKNIADHLEYKKHKL